MTLPRTLVLVNGLAALGSAVACVIGLVDPAALLPSGSAVTSSVDVYARLYGARALPLSAVVLYLLVTGTRRGLIPVLMIAGLVQAADAAIGIASHAPGMVVGGTVAAAIHLVSAAFLARGTRVNGPARLSE
ncbi:hypothetical protein [Actinoallomurus rhizosphaericola]|uniref:hypothetical protein n=1 Tax=Actinoallomurus rhizosphaericola TaxID=2952536 RepID=UPI0020933264|nr:hypothetical protein [Actinoallomurus rhizosphaericola]MCO6000311.1 hypothetical protein [Actinoallomurus rhizosphaericola]